MDYPNTWREDRKSGRGGGFQGRTRAIPRFTPRQIGLAGLGFPEADFRAAKRFATAGARLGTRFLPWVGLGLLAVDVGWWMYQRNMPAPRLEPFAPPAGWTVGNLGCHVDDGFNKQYHQGNEFCIGPFAHTTIDGPWGMQIPDDKTVLHRLYRRTDLTGHSVAWWRRSGSDNNFPRGGYETQPVIPISTITPGSNHDPMDVPLQPAPQVVPDPYPLSPYPGIAPRNWRSPTDRSFFGPRPAKPIIIILYNPNQLPIRKPKRKKQRVPPFWPLFLNIEVEPDEEFRPDPFPREAEEEEPRPELPPLWWPEIFGEGWSPWRKPLPLPNIPRTQPAPKFTIQPHRPARPGRGVRERKARTKSPFAFAIIRGLFEQVFEAFDYVEAVYNSLPLNVRIWYERELGFGARDPIQQMAVIHRHYDLIDIPEMINNLIFNEFEDFVFGLLGKISQTTARRLGLSVGPGFGQGSIRSHAQQKAWDLELERVRNNIQFVLDEVETFK